jgi:hypothetical protein
MSSKRIWISICSTHREKGETCTRCQAGYWESTTRLFWSGMFYRLCPWGWRLWVNRKNSPDRKRLEGWFPNLKAKDRP